MNQLTRLLLVGLAAVAPGALAVCPVTPPANPAVDVPGANRTDSRWYGTDALAVELPWQGTLIGLGPAHNFREKLWFWRRGYEAGVEAHPLLGVAGVKFGSGEKSQRLSVRRATNGGGSGWEQMLTLVEFPSSGCWELTATYVHADIEQELKFVIRVGVEITGTDIT